MRRFISPRTDYLGVHNRSRMRNGRARVQSLDCTAAFLSLEELRVISLPVLVVTVNSF